MTFSPVGENRNERAGNTCLLQPRGWLESYLSESFQNLIGKLDVRLETAPIARFRQEKTNSLFDRSPIPRHLRPDQMAESLIQDPLSFLKGELGRRG